MKVLESLSLAESRKSSAWQKYCSKPSQLERYQLLTDWSSLQKKAPEYNLCDRKDEHSLIAAYCQKLSEGHLSHLIPESPMQVDTKCHHQPRPPPPSTGGFRDWRWAAKRVGAHDPWAGGRERQPEGAAAANLNITSAKFSQMKYFQYDDWSML